MKEFYYYQDLEGDDKNSPKKATICLMLGDEENESFRGYPFARGVAVCSDRDNFSKKIGRAIAKGRAMKALMKGNYGKVRRPEVKSSLPKEFQYKGTVRPEKTGITYTEAKLMASFLGIGQKEEVA